MPRDYLTVPIPAVAAEVRHQGHRGWRPSASPQASGRWLHSPAPAATGYRGDIPATTSNLCPCWSCRVAEHSAETRRAAPQGRQAVTLFGRCIQSFCMPEITAQAGVLLPFGHQNRLDSPRRLRAGGQGGTADPTARSQIMVAAQGMPLPLVQLALEWELNQWEIHNDRSISFANRSRH